MTKNTPATSLPWSFQSDAVYSDDDQRVTCGGRFTPAASKDAAYIAHTANAYPLLVAMLKTYAEALSVDLHKAVLDGSDATALLRELGEL